MASYKYQNTRPVGFDSLVKCKSEFCNCLIKQDKGYCNKCQDKINKGKINGTIPDN
jgi:hypothetical protein